MKIDIISYSDAQYEAFTEEQIQEIKSAQLKKNKLERALAEAKRIFFTVPRTRTATESRSPGATANGSPANSQAVPFLPGSPETTSAFSPL